MAYGIGCRGRQRNHGLSIKQVQLQQVAQLIEEGPKVDVIVVTLMGNDFIDQHWQPLCSYPEHVDRDHRRLVAAAAMKSERCVFLLHVYLP